MATAPFVYAQCASQIHSELLSNLRFLKKVRRSLPRLGMGSFLNWASMDKVRQFRQRAHECREMASKAATAEIRGHYENLAKMWEKLAEERKAFFLQRPDMRDWTLTFKR